jgi:3-hydroxy acid dehydrogenase/malonic semialdehyde reductase
MNTVLITGATSGIGKATAEILAENNYRLILCGRRKDRLEALKRDLACKTEVLTLNFDVGINDAVVKGVSSLPASWKDIDVLINNAGNAHGLDPIHLGNITDWDAMIDSNVKGLLYVSRAVIPGMVDRKKGHIINIGSIAGKEVYPGGNVYCASKYAVDAITQGMRIDLNAYGIKVTSVNPGLVNTEFSNVRFKGDMAKANQVYNGMTPLTASDIAEIILFVLTRPPHVTVADLLVLPTAQASAGRIKRVD